VEKKLEDTQLHSKKCWVVSTQILVSYGQTQNLQLKVKVEVGLILNYIFNPTFGFVHI